MFRDLNCNVHESDRTSSGHPQLGVALDVQFVDLPGRGDPIGDDTINVELNKADTVLFFSSSQSGRQVSSQDIADIFSRRKRRLFFGVFTVFTSTLYETLNLHLRTDQPKKAHVLVYKVKDRFC